eukprot:7382794-Prymnesium_polylepis.1
MDVCDAPPPAPQPSPKACCASPEKAADDALWAEASAAIFRYDGGAPTPPRAAASQFHMAGEPVG